MMLFCLTYFNTPIMETLKVLLQTAIDSGNLADKQIFYKALYKQYFFLVYAVAKRWHPSLADDIVQEVFLSKVLSRSLTDLSRILNHRNFAAFLVKATQHRCFDVHAVRVREQDKVDALSVDKSDPSSTKDGKIDFEPLRRYLSVQEIRLLDLKFNQGLENFEIRDQLGIREDAVRQRLSRAVKKLRKNLCVG